MADDAEDVLELDTELDAEEVEGEEQDADDEASSDETEDDDGETVIGFGDEEDEDEAAPASESESSVIRDMRAKLRERDRELAELRRSVAPPKVELGPKPTLESCDYDEEAFETSLTEWHAQKAKFEAQEAEEKAATERQRAEWQGKVEAYQTAKTTLGVADFEDAEAEVFSHLPNDVTALLVRIGNPALVYALHRSPSKLEQLSKLNLADAAVQLGEWKAGLKVTKRKAPAPDRPLKGKAGSTSNGNLEKLLKQARETGDYSSYSAAKRAAQS